MRWLLGLMMTFIGFQAVALDRPFSNNDYILQAGDIVRIVVWNEPNLEQELAIQPDGYVSMPLAGQVQLGKKTIRHSELDIAKKLKNFITDPIVSISLLQPMGNKVYVIGQVNRPGEYLLGQTTDVLQALSKAGGFTAYANYKAIQVIRKESGTTTVSSFNYKDITKGRNLDQNIALKAGDTIVVP